MIALQLAAERFGPAAAVTGHVVAQADVETRSVEVMLSFRERTADFEELSVGGRTGSLHQGPMPAGTGVPFALQLPPDALPPYRSQWGELFWQVDAKAEVAQGPALVAVERIIVAPPEIEDWQLAGENADKFVRLMPAKLAEMSAAPDIFGNRPKTVPGEAAPPPEQAAGWHPDPWREKRMRWWDGRTWTGHTAD